MNFHNATSNITTSPAHILFPRDFTKWWVEDVIIHNSGPQPVTLSYSSVGLPIYVADETGEHMGTWINVPARSDLTITIQKRPCAPGDDVYEDMCQWVREERYLQLEYFWVPIKRIPIHLHGPTVCPRVVLGALAEELQLNDQ